MNSNPILDPQKQQKAKEYSRIKRRLMVVDMAWNAIYAVLWLSLGWVTELKDWLIGDTLNDWFLVAGFIIIFGGISSLLTAPLSYYSGYVLPHRYELSTQTLKEWITDQIKGLLVGGPIGLLVIELVYLFLRAFPDTWWMWTAGFLLVFNVVLGNLYPVLIAPIFNKFTPLEEEHQDLANRLISLAKKANTQVKGVYKFDLSKRTKAANAALMGIGNSRRIILGDTLIEEFTSDEIETVLAHELGHHVNKDITYGIFISTIITVGGLYLTSLALNWGVNYFGFQNIADIAAFPLFGLVLGTYGLITMPINNGWSRSREVMADQYALESTNKSQAFASALTRLANQNLADVDPEPWVEWLLHSHPSLSKRIKRADIFSK